MSRTRIAFATFVGLCVVLASFLAAVAVGKAEEPVRCGTWHYTRTGPDVFVHDYTLDAGLRWSTVGHYLWLQNTVEGHSSTEHLTSVPLEFGEWTVTACTDDTTWAAEAVVEVVSEQPGGQSDITAKVVVVRRHQPL